MEIIKNTNGFPYAWKAGRVEYLIREILSSKAQTQLNVNKVMFVNPTWMHEDNIVEKIKEKTPDFIICHNFADPVLPKVFDAIKNSGIPYLIIGNASHCRFLGNGVRFIFQALYRPRHFPLSGIKEIYLLK